MASKDSSPDLPKDSSPDLRKDETDLGMENATVPEPKPEDNRKKSVAESAKQSLDSMERSSPEEAKDSQSQPAADGQPAVVVAAVDKIEPLSDQSVQRPPAIPLDPPSTVSSYLRSFTFNCAKAASKEGCMPSMFISFFFGFLMLGLLALSRQLIPDLYMVAASLLSYIFFAYKVKRGIRAKDIPIDLDGSKRNPYQDSPSVHEGDPMEPPCPRPQEEPPKELVYKADVHHADQTPSLSSPSSSSGAKGLDPEKTPSSPSESGKVTVDVHASSQETESKSDEARKSGNSSPQ